MRVSPKYSAILGFALVTLVASAQGQDPELGFGAVPYQTFLGERENMNLANGNLNVQVPLLKLPGRNGHDFVINLSYNSQVWYLHSFTPPVGPTVYQWTWTNTTGWVWNLPQLLSDSNVPPNGNTSYSCGGNFRMTTWDGRVVYFPNLYTGCLYTGGGAPYPPAPQVESHTSSSGFPFQGGGFCAASDHYVIEMPNGGPAKVHLGNGETLTFSGADQLTQDEDANGNIITYAYGNGVTVTDTVGRTITIAGQAGGVPSSITYTDTNGSAQTITFSSQNYTIHTHLGNPVEGERDSGLKLNAIPL